MFAKGINFSKMLKSDQQNYLLRFNVFYQQTETFVILRKRFCPNELVLLLVVAAPNIVSYEIFTHKMALPFSNRLNEFKHKC